MAPGRTWCGYTIHCSEHQGGQSNAPGGEIGGNSREALSLGLSKLPSSATQAVIATRSRDHPNVFFSTDLTVLSPLSGTFLLSLIQHGAQSAGTVSFLFDL